MQVKVRIKDVVTINNAKGLRENQPIVLLDQSKEWVDRGNSLEQSLL